MVFLTFRNFPRDRRCAAIEGRLPLVHFAADETVEVIKALQARPAIERTGDTCLPIGDVGVLADERRAITVLAQDLGEHAGALRDLSAVARVSIAYLRNN